MYVYEGKFNRMHLWIYMCMYGYMYAFICVCISVYVYVYIDITNGNFDHSPSSSGMTLSQIAHLKIISVVYNSRITCTAHTDTDMFDTLFMFLHLLYICYILLCSLSFPPPEDEISCFTFHNIHDYIAAVCNKLSGHRRAHQAGHTFNIKPNHSFCWPLIMRHGGYWSKHIF